MKTTIECKKCSAIYVIKFDTHKKHTVNSKCTFCGSAEKIEVGRD